MSLKFILWSCLTVSLVWVVASCAVNSLIEKETVKASPVSNTDSVAKVLSDEEVNKQLREQVVEVINQRLNRPVSYIMTRAAVRVRRNFDWGVFTTLKPGIDNGKSIAVLTITKNANTKGRSVISPQRSIDIEINRLTGAMLMRDNDDNEFDAVGWSQVMNEKSLIKMTESNSFFRLD
jgi:hypothetical protein